MGHQAYLKIIRNCIKSRPLRFLGQFLIFSENMAMQHICRHYYMIKLIKIIIIYIKGAYTTDKHNTIIGIPFLQVGEDDIVIDILIISV